MLFFQFSFSFSFFLLISPVVPFPVKLGSIHLERCKDVVRKLIFDYKKRPATKQVWDFFFRISIFRSLVFFFFIFLFDPFFSVLYFECFIFFFIHLNLELSFSSFLFYFIFSLSFVPPLFRPSSERSVGASSAGPSLRWMAQNFALSLSRRKFRSLSSLWGSSRGIVAAVQIHDPPKVRIWTPWDHFAKTPTAWYLALHYLRSKSGHEIDCGPPC